jgi:hypothetical protein
MTNDTSRRSYMDTQAVVLELPATLYQTALQVAQATGEAVESVLQASIAHALPPLDDVSPAEQTELAALALLDDAALWRVARSSMLEDDQRELNELLERQGTGELTPKNQVRLQVLLDIYGRTLVRKAHASLLLARRGYTVPHQSTP